MSLLNYFKEITIGWKLSLFLVVFCVWPISAYLIFHFDPLLFTNLDLAKLTLLSSAIASPFLVVNTGVSFLLTDPKDKDLKWGSTPDQLLSGTILVGIGISLWVLSFGAVAALMDCSLLTVKLIMICIEVAALVIIFWSKLIEDKRFKIK
ncbi:hypothetical protein FBD94_07975 [Pedobacter hiemivivus]|uniref:Uncharacterized protein n=1 Tax=Pedobacter hiemivivus TaxID=2530454 RepID=A0A4U1GDL3_9SPHI|nr:hypothetical protein [Pedobacter hiemivivus]TKC62151.1 hypothetical protein FBD94_07975 [Pedobacter hiemivivus]